MAIICKKFLFEAGHLLTDYLDEDGQPGQCARLHGHSYLLEVAVVGPIQPERGRSDDGMVVDYAVLSRLVKQVIIERLDHQYLNDVLAPRRTTAENIACWIGAQLEAAGLPLHHIRLSETRSSSVEVTPAEWRHPAGETLVAEGDGRQQAPRAEQGERV
jgi:6-pyruvoyltetrahydropterin/6-carboxytetrahydropterin synthase